VWQQDRFSNGGALGLVAGYSRDAGRTWGEAPLPFSRCAPGGLSYDRASDPAVSVGPDGRAYAVSLSFTPNEVPPSFTAADAIASATSTDGGRSWHRVGILDEDANGGVQGFLDKEWVVADPARPGIAYATWDHFTPLADGGFHVPARFSRTTDGGRTWSPFQTVAAIPNDEAATIDTPLVDPRTGAVYVFFTWSAPHQPARLAFVKSTTRGHTWSAPRAVTAVGSVGVFDPNNGRHLRTGDGLFSVAINPLTGRLHLAWQSARFSAGQYDESLLATSDDGGRSWSAPTVLSTRYGGPAFLPTIAVNSTGRVGLSWYDFRHDDPATAALTTQVWFRTVSATGSHVGPEQHLMGPFDFAAAPDAGGRFVGDYEGMTAVGSTFHPFNVITNCLTSCPANRTDVYTTSATATAATIPSSDVEVGESALSAAHAPLRAGRAAIR
jgi:hypothetical protein